MNDTPAPELRISGPTELIRAVPYLLGFIPTADLIVVGMRGPKLVTTVRLNLELAARQLPSVLAALAGAGVSEVFAVLWHGGIADSDNVGDVNVVVALGALVDQSPVLSLSDCLWYDPDVKRWASYLCEQPGCCPPEGTPLPDVVSSFEAAAAFRGVAPAAQRSELARELAQWEPPVHPDRVANVRLGGVEACAAYILARLADATGTGAVSLTDAQVARIGAALALIPVRDVIWRAIDDGISNPEFWAMLARRLPEPYRAGPAFLYAWTHWRSGDGARANTGLKAALGADPDYSAAALLRTALVQGLSPVTTPRLSEMGIG